MQPETGASVAASARLWYTLPYALISAPLDTALYTELARDAAVGDLAWALGLGVAAGGGMPQIALSMLASYGVTGAGVLELLQTFVAPLVSYAADGTVTTAPIIQTVAYTALVGRVAGRR